MNWIVQNLWLIPVLPLLAAGLSALAPKRCRRFSASLAIGSMGLSFLLACCAFVTTLKQSDHGEIFRQVSNFDWLVFGDATLKLGWMLDPLTAVMLLMVTFVGLLIFIYSVGYMARDENFTRFFCFMSLFAAAMLGLVIANSLLLFFISWELVGLASYLLIGFWYHKPSAAAAAKKAFIVTRIGDIGFFLGLLWLYSETGTLLFYDNGNGCLEQSTLTKLVAQTTSVGMAVSTGISLLIFCGAIGKSGQVPLHVWLPDAMEGPTPVSALIHAATMVAAGVFLVARVYPLMEAVPAEGNFQLAISSSQHRFARARDLSEFSTSQPEQTLTPPLSLSKRERENSRPVAQESNRVVPSAAGQSASIAAIGLPLPEGAGRGEGERSSHDSSTSVSVALKVVTWIGAVTAVFAALIAIAQTDIKRILAYSTISQLGYMFMGLGVGGVAVGMFHLITHAFFKALLFLGAGSVIHGCHEEQDIRRMGGLRKLMPVTFATYAIGMMALSGVPLLFSGFWSKDEILHAAWLWEPSKWPFVLGLFGALLTAFYMMRQVCYVFFGKFRSSRRKEAHSETRNPKSEVRNDSEPHESPPTMTWPLIVLAAFAILLGFIGTPAWPWFQHYLGGAHEPPQWTGLVFLMLVSSAVVFFGLALGWWLYGRHPEPNADAPDPLERRQPVLFRVLRDKFYVDELYEATVVRLNTRFTRFCHWIDSFVLDTLIVGVSYVVLGISWLNRLLDDYVVNPGFDQACERVRRGGGFLSSLQNGQVQTYLRVIGLALTVLLLLLMWGCAK